MSIGTISSLGVGSGFELQELLNQLREADEAPITIIKAEKTEVEERLAEFDVVNAKVLAMKSHALALSLESNFLERDISISDEEVLTATVVTGTSETSNSVEVNRLATRSSWQSAGIAGSSTSVYVPTIQESTTGFADTGTTAVTTANETMTVTYASGTDLKTINVDLTSGMTLDQIVDALNTDSDNDDGEGSTYITASTFTGADGKYYLRIASTAGGSGETNRVMVTNFPTGLNFSAPSATFSYSIGSGSTPISVSVAADTTLNGLVTLINDDSNNPGVTASVVDDGSGANSYRLVLTADSSGEDNRISIETQLVDLNLIEAQGSGGASLNAEIVVNGINYQRQKNTGISDIVQGITFNFETVGSATVKVSADTDFIQSEIERLVESFNDLVQEINANSNYDEETEEWGSLAFSPSIKGLVDELNTLMSTVASTGGSITSMYDLGMEFNRDGTITMDADDLTSVISSNFDDIRSLFLSNASSSVTGLGDVLNDRLGDITKSSGLLDTEKDEAQNEIDRLDADIEASTERLDRRFEILTRQFIELDVYVSQMQSQSAYLSNIFDSFNSSTTT
jgi:flagellar hook-associated protein 2